MKFTHKYSVICTSTNSICAFFNLKEDGDDWIIRLKGKYPHQSYKLYGQLK
jgi:hypothetical protein